MRILALRGSNLASLQGHFEVDLRAGLGGAGLFAITGPTGAGKSTLLDALCLALFDSTPRLDTRATARIGREGEDERLPAQDVRSLLRRGCAHCFAEVDFEGADLRRYRARWTVRRARDKADGRLQNSEVTLQDLESGHQLGDTRKTATLQEIERKLGGLTFQQFRRSVLLAQGDFAAFLKATGPERAELLERMTGTDIYTRLSKASHERARVEKEVLDRLQAEAGAMALLSAEDRQALEAGLVEERQGLVLAEEAVRRAEAAVTWHRVLAELVQAEGVAAAAAEQAGQALAGAAPLRDELAAVEAAEPLRDQVREVDDASRELVLATKAVEEGARLEAGLAASHEALKSAQAEAELRRTAAVTAREAAHPELALARTLDGQLVQAESALARVAEEVRRALESSATAAGEAAAGEKEVQAAEASRREAEAWLHEKEGLAELVRQWERWKSCLARFREADGAWRKAEEARPGLEEAVGEARRAAGEAELQVAGLREALRVADQERQALQAAAGALAAEPLRQEREAVDARLRRIEELERVATDALRCRKEEGEARADAAHLSTDAQVAEAVAAEQGALAERLGPRLEEARHARERILASLDLAEHRAGLRPGEACPLCGSVEHPYALQAPGAALAQEQAARVAELEEQVRAAVAEQQRAHESARLRRQSAADALGKAERSAGEAARHEAAWASRGAGEPDLPPLAAGALEERRRALWGRREELVAREAEALRLAEAARHASDAHEGLRKQVDQAADRHNRFSEQVRKVEESCHANGRALEAAHQVREVAVSELAGAFSATEGWEPSLRRNPAGFEKVCLQRVEEWSRREAERKQADLALAELRPRVASLRAAAEAARGEASRQEVVQAEARTSLETLRLSRSRLLAGRPADEVERDLRQAVEVAEKALKDVQEREAAAKAARQEASGRLQTSVAEAARRQALREEAGRRLAEALGNAGLEEAELRRRLGRGAEWLRAAREQLQVLEKAVQEAGIRLHEREQARRRHEAGDAPALPAENAEEARAARLAEREQVHARVARAEATLEQDSANRLVQAERLGRVEVQRETWRLWEGLREVIGSADGKRFRVFAQSLTLEALLAEANEHLRELAPRYRLERVPPPRDAGARVAEDHLEIQVVDKDMGDTVRSVQSLSGGESFLVSLALALGLSALAAERARIDSLFIDEGFGSLDAETLETALSCLESLQAGGRQVGIISHVPGLAERIGARVRVEPLGGGRSRVIVEAPGAVLAV